jgi:hypothetical protein
MTAERKRCCSQNGHGSMAETLVRTLWNNLWKEKASNKKTAAVIDAYRALFGKETRGGAFAAVCRDVGHEAVMRAIFEAARQDANVPEQYVIKTARERHQFMETEKSHERKERQREARQVEEASERAQHPSSGPNSAELMAQMRALSRKLSAGTKQPEQSDR